MEQIRSLGLIRENLSDISLKDLISGRDDEPLHSQIADAFDILESHRQLPIDIFSIDDVLSNSERYWGVSSKEIIQWASNYSQPRLGLPYLAGAVVISLFPVEALGIQIHPEITEHYIGDRNFDEDRLLDLSGANYFQPKRDGIVFGSHFVRYHPWLRQYNLGLSGGFLDLLLRTVEDPGVRVSRFGLRIDSNLLMDRRYQKDIHTREFMRGPKLPSVEQLNDPKFPESASGTITEHRRIDPEGDYGFLGIDVELLQVMWSQRDQIKTVQFEELVPIEAKEYSRYRYVLNRYVHAQWHPETRCFIHCDGAVKVYKKDDYDARLRAPGNRG